MQASDYWSASAGDVCLQPSPSTRLPHLSTLFPPLTVHWCPLDLHRRSPHYFSLLVLSIVAVVVAVVFIVIIVIIVTVVTIVTVVAVTVVVQGFFVACGSLIFLFFKLCL